MDRSIVYSVHDCKLYPITDPGDSVTPPTYGTPVDAPGIQEVTLTPNVTSNELRGDNVVLDTRSTLDSLAVALGYAKLDPDVLAVVDGGTKTTNVGGDTVRYVRDGGDKLPEFAIAAKVEEVDEVGGAAKLYVYRCRMTGGGLFSASDQSYGTPTIDAKAIALAIGALFAVDLEDTGADLPADSAALIATYAALV